MASNARKLETINQFIHYETFVYLYCSDFRCCGCLRSDTAAK